MTEKSVASTTPKRKGERSQCRICGSTAFYSYFGAISCEACKIFFKRNAQYAQNRLKCSYGGQCEINTYTRHLCTACRLAKCFREGMRSDMIRRSTIHKKINTISNTSVKSNQIPKLPTLNLLERDNSFLDEKQWILLSNLIHNYKEDELLSLTKTLRNENTLLKIINPSTVQSLMRCFYETAGNSLRFNTDIAQLETDDRSLLLYTAATNVTCIGGQLIYYHSQLIDCELFWKYLEQLYGKIAIYYKRLSSKFTASDMILCKLSIPIFALSTNTRIFIKNIEGEYQNPSQILNIQDKYVELIWKYLLYKYGYDESIKRYLHIIEWFLALTVFIPCTYSTNTHVDDLKSLIARIDMALISDDVDRIFDDEG